jgi:phosphate transport system substrate-binding protein
MSLRETLRWLIVMASLGGSVIAILLGSTPIARAVEDPLDRPLRIVGSGYSMPVLMRPWIEAFERETGVVVEVVPSGTSTGPPALIEGRADVAAMTRPLRDDEANGILRRFGEPAVVLPVARDEVAVFVNVKNPIDRITLPQIDAIYSDSRRCGAPADITRWGQLGVVGEFADRAIALFGRRPGSGTATFFGMRALCGGDFKDWMRISPGRTSASLRVVESRFGVGFGSVRDQQPGMKILAVAEDESGPFVRPGEDASSSSRYPLARTLDFVVAMPTQRPLHPALIAFLESVLREEAQSAASSAGYAPLAKEQVDESIERLELLR